jgi:hypothetical protein
MINNHKSNKTIFKVKPQVVGSKVLCNSTFPTAHISWIRSSGNVSNGFDALKTGESDYSYGEIKVFKERYSIGDNPVCFLKTFEKYCEVLKPVSCAIRCIESLLEESRFLAR